MKSRLFMVALSCACLTLIGCGSSDAPEDEIPGKTDVAVTLTGADVGSFKLMLSGTGLTNYSTKVQKSPAAWNVDLANYGEEIRIIAFLDVNDNSSRDPTEAKTVSLATLTEGVQNDLVMNLEKTIVTVSVTGDIVSYQHPKIVSNPSGAGSSSQFVAPIDAATIVLYGDSLAKYGDTAHLSAFEDVDDDNVMDPSESLIAATQSWGYVETTSVTIDVYN
jgi:hypothetical protein